MFKEGEWEEPGFDQRLMTYAEAEWALNNVYRDPRYSMPIETFYALRDRLRENVSPWYRDE